MRFVLAATAAFFLLAIGASAQPSPLNFQYIWRSYASLVEQQSTPDHAVTNPTGCAWDIDDSSEAIDQDGTLAAGASYSFTECQVMEGYNSPNATCTIGCARPYGISLFAPTSALDVRACFTLPGRCIQANPVYNGRRYEYRLCARVFYAYGDWEQPIPDSNGGVGIVTQQTLVVTNPTGRTVRKIDGFVDQVGWFQDAHGCVYYATDTHADYPFRWSP